MNKRIQKKRDMPSVRRAYAAMGLGVGSESQRYCEMVRCRRAMLRRMRRRKRRIVVPGTRVRWVEVSGAPRGPMGRIYLMPKGTAVALAAQFPEDKMVMRELTPDQARWKMYTTKLVQLQSVVAGLIS